MNKIKGKIKIKTKPQCDCENHYLELFKSFDGDAAVYNRMCYKCGKWWTYTTRLEHRYMKQPSLHNNIPAAVKMCTRQQLSNVAKTCRCGEILCCSDVYGITDVYAVASDGSIIRFYGRVNNSGNS